jgi:hypothetical protein
MQAEKSTSRARRRHLSWSLVFTAAAVLLRSSAPDAAPTVLTFEDLAAGTTVTTQYGVRGVLFQGTFVGTDFGARSGSRALRSVPPTSEVFNPVPIIISFTSPQARVKLFVNSPGMPRNGTLEAFDANGALVTQDGPKQVAADAFTTGFEVTSATPRITRAVFRLEGAAHYALDDLEFEGTLAAPPPLRRRW